MNVIDNATFQKIQNKQHEVSDNEIIVFKMCENNPPFHKSVIPKFKCKTVVFFKCSKDFVYMWLNKMVFSQVNTIYFSGELMHPEIMLRFKDAKWLVSEDSQGFPDVQRISNNKFKEFVNDKSIFSFIYNIYPF